MAVPRADLPKSRGRAAISDAPMVRAYATRSGDRVTLFLVSRRVPGASDDGRTDVRVTLPFKTASRVTRYRHDGAWNADPLGDAPPVMVSEQVPAALALPELHLPELGPGRSEVYVFDGVR